MALLLLVASPLLAQTVMPEPAHPVLASEQGRFVYGQVGPMRADQYLLDTKTCRLWRMVKGKDDQLYLATIPIEQITGSIAYSPEPEEEAEAARKYLAAQQPKPLPTNTESFNPDQYLKDHPAPSAPAAPDRR